MGRFRVLGMTLVMAMIATTANAAVVGFNGSLTDKVLGGAGTGVFAGGAAPSVLPAAVDFHGNITVTDGTGAITGGVFANSFGANVTIVGGTVSLTENGANDTAAFNILVGGDASGSLSFTIQADVIADSTINQGNLDAFLFIPTAAVFTDLANGAAQYTGTVQTIPEPGTLSLLGLCVGGVACWRRRRV